MIINYIDYLSRTNVASGIWDSSLNKLTSTRTTNTNPSSNSFKVLTYNGSTYVSNIIVNVTSVGTGYVTFTKNSTFDRLNIAFNGNKVDCFVRFICSDFENGTSYTLSWNVTVLDRTNTGNDASVQELVLVEGTTPVYWNTASTQIAVGNDNPDITQNGHAVLYCSENNTGIYYDKSLDEGVPTTCYESEITAIIPDYADMQAVKVRDLNCDADGLITDSSESMNYIMHMWVDDFNNIVYGGMDLDELAEDWGYADWEELCEDIVSNPEGYGGNGVKCLYSCNPSDPACIFEWKGHNYFLWTSELDQGDDDYNKYLLTSIGDFYTFKGITLESYYDAESSYDFPFLSPFIYGFHPDMSEYHGPDSLKDFVPISITRTIVPSSEYLGFICTSSGSIALRQGTTITASVMLEYRIDGGTWVDWGNSYPAINLSTGLIIEFRGSNNNISAQSYYWKFEMTGLFEGFGNITALLNGASGTTLTSLPEYCFDRLFENCTSLTKSPILNTTVDNSGILVSTGCYNKLFYGCSNLSRITCNMAGNETGLPIYCSDWVHGVGSTGIFKHPIVSGHSWSSGDSGIPPFWQSPAIIGQQII